MGSKPVALIHRLSPEVIANPGALSKAEGKRLASLEQGIHDASMQFFHGVGQALKEINENRLYRATHKTFDAYCEERLDIRRETAYRLIRAAEVVSNIQSIVPNVPLPSAESQVRELAALSPGQQAQVWAEACALADGRPRAKDVEAVLANRQAAEAGPSRPMRKGKSAAAEPEQEDDDQEDDEDEATDEDGNPLSDELFTPEPHVEAIRDVLGWIDLDPASCEEANEVVRATRIFTKEDDALKQDWACDTLYMNSPFSRGKINRFVERCLKAYNDGEIRKEGILLVNAATGTKWFEGLWDHPCCFVRGRVTFRKSKALAKYLEEKAKKTGKPVPTNGNYDSVYVYLGPDPWKFYERFSKIGRIARGISMPELPHDAADE